MIYAETLLVLAIFALLFYLSMRVRVFLRSVKDSGPVGFGLVLIALGLVLFALITGRLVKPTGIVSEDQIVQGAFFLTAAGVAFIVIDFILKKLRKKELLGLEGEKREYLKRVRKGMTLEDAEKKAKELIEKQGKHGVKVIASDREFKTWSVFLEAGAEKFKVTIDMDGDVVDWETMDKLPSYLTGAN